MADPADAEFRASVLDRIDLRERVVLDAGCGAGGSLKAMLPRGPLEVVCIDTDPNGFGEIQKIARRYPETRVRMLVADMNDMPALRGGTFDVVVASFSLQGYDSLREFRRVLEPGGCCVLLSSAAQQPDERVAEARKTEAAPAALPQTDDDPWTAREWLNALGFDILEFRRYEAPPAGAAPDEAGSYFSIIARKRQGDGHEP